MSDLSLFRIAARHVLLAAMLAVSLPGCKWLMKDTEKTPKAEVALPRSGPVAIRGPMEYALKGLAGDAVNLDANGKSLSIVVRIYQLKDKNEFARLTFNAFTSGKRDGELFPTEFLAVKEVVLIPGAALELTERLLPEAGYVGVAAFFRKPDAQAWRFLVDARAVAKEGLNFSVRTCYLEQVQPDPEPLPGMKAGYVPGCAATRAYGE
ncbi:MAG: type VI secretion system lipoprotein TssJ [Zoogloeaceae bacterium]|jgi:type VI secretion system protein VasD|nr:type VI secretion system lipoprotein TssJ [Zoogloeaceae bacterium]